MTTIEAKKYISLTDAEKGKNLSVLNKIFKEREDLLRSYFYNLLPTMVQVSKVQKLELCHSSFHKPQEGLPIFNGDLIVGMTWFGIEDMLYPIEDYIKELDKVAVEFVKNHESFFNDWSARNIKI